MTRNVRRRVSVSFSSWRGEVRASLREARTSRCTARYGQRGTRVGEAAHPGPTRRLKTERGPSIVHTGNPLSMAAILMTRCLSCADQSDHRMDWRVTFPCLKRSSCQTEVVQSKGVSVSPRPSRRLVLVPQSVDGTPQSIQDREWDAGVETHNRFSPLQDT